MVDAMTPTAFIAKWGASELRERQGAQEHFIDLCRLLGEKTPAEPEVVPGFPDRILPKDEAAAKMLKTRTLTNLYNERPAWLANAHRTLDEAVAAAYGWAADLSDDEILARLFAPNQQRAAAGR